MNSWLHLWQALLMGGLLGICYEFLQPLRPQWVSDLLFLWPCYQNKMFYIYAFICPKS